MTATEQAVADFIGYIRSVRRLSPHTVAAYQRDLQALVEIAGERSPADLSATELRRLLARRRDAKPSSITRQLAAWRRFYDFLLSGGGVLTNPLNAITPPKRPARLPKALSPDEMSALLQPAEAGNQWLLARDSAIMELLYSAALRLSELVQLNVNEVDLSAQVVYISRGKGGRGRVAPLGSMARQALQHWLPLRKERLAGSVQPALFIGRNRTRLTPRAVQKRIDEHVKKIGFNRPVSPHVFRHSCASHFLQSSGNLRATRELLGHKDITATQIYTRLDFQHLAKIYDSAHPRGKK